jgi:hypothetical protein
MVADLINLRTARKKKLALEKEQRAAENRAYFGRTKEEKAAEEGRRNKLRGKVDGHRLFPRGME